MLEKNADVNCCFLCSVIFIEYYSTMHCNEVLQACQVDPIYCDIFGAAERVLRYGLPINLRYIFKRVPARENSFAHLAIAPNYKSYISFVNK